MTNLKTYFPAASQSPQNRLWTPCPGDQVPQDDRAGPCHKSPSCPPLTVTQQYSNIPMKPLALFAEYALLTPTCHGPCSLSQLPTCLGEPCPPLMWHLWDSIYLGSERINCYLAPLLCPLLRHPHPHMAAPEWPSHERIQNSNRAAAQSFPIELDTTYG